MNLISFRFVLWILKMQVENKDFDLDKTEIKHISSVMENPYLVRLIRNYAQNFAFYRATQLVATLTVAKTHEDILQKWAKQMGPYLGSPRQTSWYLSRIYCWVFDKEMPSKTVPIRRPEPYSCLEGHGKFYPSDGKSRQGRFIYCGDCSEHQLMPRGWVNVSKSPDFVFGQEEIPTHEIFIPTKAFKFLARHDKATLLVTARDVFDILRGEAPLKPQNSSL